MDNSVIDLSLSNIWKSWFLFKRGKKKSQELEHFTYYLEQNLFNLYDNLQSGLYRHGLYRKFIVTDNKRREVLVAGIKDRVVHRLMYEYLRELYDKAFIFDVWSCRPHKGLMGAIERTQYFLKKHPHFFVWRSDIKKFFDSVDQKRIIEILSFKVKDQEAIKLLKEIINSHAVVIERERERERVNTTFLKRAFR